MGFFPDLVKQFSDKLEKKIDILLRVDGVHCKFWGILRRRKVYQNRGDAVLCMNF